MPPRSRRSRWRRTWTRSAATILVPLAAVVLVLAFVVGALSHVGRGSGPYWRTVDRSFAALAAIVAARSNATGLALAEDLVNGPKMPRADFFSALDQVASNAADQSRQLSAAVPPAPRGGAGDGCLAAMFGRASATAAIRDSLEGLLGGTDGAAVVPAPKALAALDTAASNVVGADDDWAACRRAVHRTPGTPTLAVSRWLAGQGWYTPAALASSVNSVVTSPTLAARHALAVTATRLDPSPLPSAGPALVAPTTTLTVHVVVSDLGNVDEPAVQVRAVLVGGTASPAPLSAIVALRAGRSVAVVLGPIPVVPGSAYTLQVFVTPPSGTGGASEATALQVASEPTTTTTTTTTTAPKQQGRPTSTP